MEVHRLIHRASLKNVEIARIILITVLSRYFLGFFIRDNRCGAKPQFFPVFLGFFVAPQAF